VDLYTSDLPRARDFYGELLGWTSESAGEEYGGYVNFSKDGHRVAGSMANQSGGAQPDFWTVYLSVPDLDATAEAVKAAGGQLHAGPMDVMALGRMAVAGDPSGASIGIWQPGEHKGFALLAEPGAPAWFELHTRGYDDAVAFYRTVFGWDTHTAGDSPEFRYTTLGEGDDARAGIMDASGFLPEGAPSMWQVYFRVDDVDATVGTLERLGGKVLQPAEDTPYGRLAAVADPTGASFRLLQP
jgi:predicted enzyme related to lactoylglutathione lyase